MHPTSTIMDVMVKNNSVLLMKLFCQQSCSMTCDASFECHHCVQGDETSRTNHTIEYIQ